MKSDIDDFCDAFIAALADAGYAPKSIENYKQISNRSKRFCTENDYDTYTVNIGQMFADKAFHEETGELVGYRHVMYGRFVRLMDPFHLQDAFDFSMITKEKDLPKSIQLIEVYQNYTKYLKAQYSNIGTVGFFQNGMLRLLQHMEKSEIPTLADLAVADVVNYICSWSQNHQRNTLCILRNIFQHFECEELLFGSGRDPSISRKTNRSNVYGQGDFKYKRRIIIAVCISQRYSNTFIGAYNRNPCG